MTANAIINELQRIHIYHQRQLKKKHKYSEQRWEEMHMDLLLIKYYEKLLVHKIINYLYKKPKL